MLPKRFLALALCLVCLPVAAQVSLLVKTNTPRGTNVSAGMVFMQSGYADYTNVMWYDRTNGIMHAPHYAGDGSGLSGVSGGGITITQLNFSSNQLYALLTYAPPSITSFGNNVGNQEIGATIVTTILSWTLGGAAITSQSLNQSIGSIGISLRGWTNVSSTTTDRTYTLTVSDGLNPASASTTILFQNKRYWGSQASTSLTDGQIVGLSSELSTSYQQSRSITASAQYIYFAFPDSFGTPQFTVNGLLNTAWTLVTRAFVNASGFSSTYRIYRSDNLLTGTYTVSLAP